MPDKGPLKYSNNKPATSLDFEHEKGNLSIYDDTFFFHIL